MINKKLGKMILTAGLASVLVLSASACGGGTAKSSSAAASSAAASSKAAGSSAQAASSAQASSAAQSSAAPASSSASTSSELGQKDMDSLLQQIADKHLEKRYVKFLGDENDQLFAVAEVFGIDRKDNTGTMYALVRASEYVSFKGDAFDMQGISAEGIFTFEYTSNGPKLKDITWSADAAAHDPWMKQNYPEKYYKAWLAYKTEDSSGKNKLNTAIEAAVTKRMGVEIADTLLTIEDDGSYEVVKTTESGTGADYKFETEVIDKGKL